jgi:hypothetical protein
VNESEAISKDPKGLTEAAVEALAKNIRDWDYHVANETELCHMFFSSFMQLCDNYALPVSCLKAEIRLHPQGSVDFGIKTINEDKGQFSVFIEAKTWLRPLKVSAWSKSNQSASKRNQCIEDAQRLLRLKNSGACSDSALLILEQSSSHIRRLLGGSLKEKGMYFKEIWLDIERPSMGKRKEHLGLIWIL